MLAKNEFYVVVIDDKINVCRRIEEKLTGGPSPGHIGPGMLVKVRTIHVALEEVGRSDNILNSRWVFKRDVLSQLIEAGRKKPNLILIDYIYVDSEVSKVLKEKAIQGLVSEEMISNKVLTPVDLRIWAQGNSTLTTEEKNLILKNLFFADCPVYLHTYTPQGTSSVVGNVTDRIKKVAQVFPNAVINSIDARSEFFNNEEFDWPNPISRYDNQYYPYQLATYFDQVVQKEIIRSELMRNRYLRIKRTTFAVGIISAIGAAVGFAGGWVGSLLSNLVEKKQYLPAFIMGLTLLILLIIAGAFCPIIFEKWMQRLVPFDESINRDKLK